MDLKNHIVCLDYARVSLCGPEESYCMFGFCVVCVDLKNHIVCLDYAVVWAPVMCFCLRLDGSRSDIDFSKSMSDYGLIPFSGS